LQCFYNLSSEKKLVGIVVIAILFIGFLFLILPSSSTPEKYSGSFNNVNIAENETDHYRLYTINNEYVEFDFWVTEGNAVDIYILSVAELTDYRDGKEFTPVFSAEDVHRINDRYHVETHNTFYLIVDNQDNVRTSDAEPNGGVEYSLEYSVNNPHWWDSVAGWEGMLWIIGLVLVICCLVAYGIVTWGKESDYSEWMKIVSSRKPPPPHHQKRTEVRKSETMDPEKGGHEPNDDYEGEVGGRRSGCETECRGEESGGNKRTHGFGE